MSDTPLAMTISEAGSHTGFTARDVVSDWQEDSIADIIYGFGEDRLARKIARAIVEARETAEIVTAKQLADIISAKIPRRGRIHPATKTFQALRIAVNDELGVISEALDSWWAQLPAGGRISVITFHSLEDRVVKRWMLAREDGTVTTKKPVAPSDEELERNPRSRSAKLRTIQKA
jgi:16S rRNA (cytosine1402-N4)-methyltransferase